MGAGSGGARALAGDGGPARPGVAEGYEVELDAVPVAVDVIGGSGEAMGPSGLTSVRKLQNRDQQQNHEDEDDGVHGSNYALT